MNHQRIRSYESVSDRIHRAASHFKECSLTRLGEINQRETRYPVYMLRLSSGKAPNGQKRKVCLSAGIHGDEPAGVEALLMGIEGRALFEPFLSNMEFVIFPCINPYGYEHDTRVNGQGFDLNRKFDRIRPPKEVSYVKRVLEGEKLHLSMEFHEDVDTDGFYLYEIKKQKPYFGEAIIREVSGSCRINARRQIEGLPSSGGIIRPDIADILRFRKRDWPQAIFLFRNGARHCITCETPVHPPLKGRALLHLLALQTALKQLGSASRPPAQRPLSNARVG